jgi:hypothetical protein
MIEKTTNMDGLITNLMGEFDRLREQMDAGEPNPEMVKAAYAAAATAGKAIAGMALQLEYGRRHGQVPVISFMEGAVKQISKKAA